MSPPLPPPPTLNQQQKASTPPVSQHFDYPQGGVPPPPPEFSDTLDDDQPLPMPEEDPYAATGPDLTEPQWMPKKYLEKGTFVCVGFFFPLFKFCLTLLLIFC